MAGDNDEGPFVEDDDFGDGDDISPFGRHHQLTSVNDRHSKMSANVNTNTNKIDTNSLGGMGMGVGGGMGGGMGKGEGSGNGNGKIVGNAGKEGGKEIGAGGLMGLMQSKQQTILNSEGGVHEKPSK